MKGMGMILVIVGCVIAAIGLVLLVAPRIPWLGHLPGDIHYRGENTSIRLPITTCVVFSIVLTLAVNGLLRLFR